MCWLGIGGGGAADGDGGAQLFFGCAALNGFAK